MPATHFKSSVQLSTEEVVVSGVACRFPESYDVEQYAQRLLNTQKYVEVSRPAEFDAKFFGITSDVAEKMSLQSKYLVECTYDAMIDSGIVPSEFKQTNTGVFVATTEVEQKLRMGQFLSTVFDFRGPVREIVNQFSSSFLALDAAYESIRSGECDQAIVSGIDMFTVEPTVGCVFIQKKDACKRFYAKVLDSRVYTYQGLESTDKLKQFYSQWQIDPTLVTYVENFGESERIEEYQALAKVFAPSTIERTLPVYFGSVFYKSQERFPTGITSLIKMIVAIQSGIIPASSEEFRFTNSIARDAKFVQTNSKFYGGLMALNSFGRQGLNSHIVLQPNTDFLMSKLGRSCYWNQDLKEVSTMPRLFNFAAKTQQGLEKIMEEVRMKPADMAAQLLLNDTAMPVGEEVYRGYTILNSEKQYQKIEQVRTEKRPVYYVFSGLNADWYKNYEEMMKIETFRRSIVESAEFLKPYGFDLIELFKLTSKDQMMKTLNAFVGITAIQMALVDCLYQAGVKVDGLIGHSIGELACAYADRSLTAQETILAAYQRGKVIEEAKLPAGAMAVVGLTWEQAQKRCPVGVVPACYNHEENVTVSGSKKAVQQFVQQLTSEGIYAKEFNTNEIAYHSHFMTSIAPQMKVALEKIITDVKPRSSKWISTSIPEQRWSSSLAKNASADYFVNNLCSHVLFKDALRHVPSNAIVIEIGPLSVMQTILQKALSPKNIMIPLMGQVTDSQLVYFWTQLGRMYLEGVQIRSINLFIPRNRDTTIYPVPVNTRFITAQHQQLKQMHIKSAQQLKQHLEQKYETKHIQQTQTLEALKQAASEWRKEIESQISSQWKGSQEIRFESQLSLVKMLLRQENLTVQQKRVLEELETLFRLTESKYTMAQIEEVMDAIYRLESLYTLKSGQQWKWIQELKESFINKEINYETRQYQQDRFALIKQFLRQENLTVQQKRILEELEVSFRNTSTSYPKKYEHEIRLIESLGIFSQDAQQMRLIQSLKDTIPRIYMDKLRQDSEWIRCDDLWRPSTIKQSTQTLKKEEPRIQLDVTRGQESKVECQHDEWVKCQECLTTEKISTRYTIDLASEESYLMGHKLQGKSFYPASAYIYLVWKTIAKLHGFEVVEQFPVQFSNIKFLNQITLTRAEKINFLVEINRLTGLFEVTESGRMIVTGVVESLNKLAQMKESFIPRQSETVSQFEIYKTLEKRGFELKNEFQPIVKANLDGSYGELLFTGKWISFLDGLIQMSVLAQKTESGSVLPTLIKSIRIEPSQITRSVSIDENNNSLNASWLEQEYQYMLNGKVSTDISYEKQYQWIQRYQQYQKEQLVTIEGILRKFTLTAEQKRQLEELETSFQRFNMIEKFQYGVDYKQQLYKQLAQLQHQLELIYTLKSFFNMESTTELSQVIEDFRRVIREQLEYQTRQYREQQKKLTEEKTVTDLLRRQLEIMTTLTQSQCTLQSELPMLQSLEKLIQEQQFYYQSKQQVELDAPEWMEQVRRHQALLNGRYGKFQQSELQTIWTFLEKTIMEQLQQELDFQTDSKQMYGSVQQRLTMNFNLVQKLIALSNAERMGRDEDATIKRMYLEKLEQLIQEMYEQTMFTQAIEESMQETYEVKRVRLQEHLENLEKFALNYRQIPVQGLRTDITGELIRWEQTFEKFQRQATEYIQGSVEKRNIPVYYYGQTKTVVCRGVEISGLYLAPVITVAPVRQQVGSLTLISEDQKLNKNELIEMDLLNLIEAMQSMESLREQQPRPVLAKITTKVSYSPLREYINSTADEAERLLIEETMSSMGKKVNYLMPQKTIVPLNQVEMYEVGEYKPTPVVIIHPIEGHVNTLKNLARYIKSPVYGVQYTRQAMQYSTIEELAQFYMSKIQAQFGETRVHLVGHAFGSLVAFEMASIRPNRFLSMTVLDDNTPMKTYKMHSEIQQEMESDALVRFAQQYLQGLNKMEFYKQLTGFETITQRIRFVVRELMNRSQFQFEPIDLEYAARSYVTKYVMMNQYTPVQTLRIPMVYMIKSGLKQSLVQIRTQLQSFLEHFFAGRLETEYVDCDFRSFLEGNNGYQVATILNENFLNQF